MLFGNYSWLVLDIQNNVALIITWANCELRKYLDNDLYNKFNRVEQEKIMLVINKN
ncbi:MAG: DUF6273 domain-containing protein [Thomasclavelia sp.]|uniref:DUF6273 domain-containing protein n=1 Tax=Thomasclavelia sp. TaxID=3025757 RepID=UPI0039A0CA58